MANSKFLLLIILCLGLTNVQSQQAECPCNPMENRGGFCSCYTCLDHKEWKLKNSKLRPGGHRRPNYNQLYAPAKYLCPDARMAPWDNVELYEWAPSTSPPQGDSYEPGAIVYERYHDTDIWETSYEKALRNKEAPKPNPCDPISKKSKKRTYAVCWYWIDYRGTKKRIAQHIKRNDKDITGDFLIFFFCTIESQFAVKFHTIFKRICAGILWSHCLLTENQR